MKSKTDNKKMSSKEFFREVNQRFPEAIDSLNFYDEDNDNPYLRISALAGFAFEYFEKGEHEKFLSIIDFVESKILLADDQLVNIICVSFVERIVFVDAKENRALIVAMLPELMTSMYESLKPLMDEHENNQQTLPAWLIEAEQMLKDIKK